MFQKSKDMSITSLYILVMGVIIFTIDVAYADEEVEVTQFVRRVVLPTNRRANNRRDSNVRDNTTNVDTRNYSQSCSGQHTIAGEKTNIGYAKKCDATYFMEDDEICLAFSKPQPLQYECNQIFTAIKNETTLHLYCPVASFRISCKYESLIINTNNTFVEVCKNETVPQISGHTLKLKYTRKLFGINGGYGCYIVAVGPIVRVLINSVNYTDPSATYINCSSCGVTVLINKTTTSPPKKTSNKSAKYQTVRIVGGVDAKLNEYPWMARLEIFDGNVHYLCGGSLITNRFVLTAAHCLQGINIVNIKVGLGVRDASIAETGSKWLNTNTTIIHELYDEIDVRNDLALIKLPVTVNFTNSIRPICLPTGSVGDLIGHNCTATGWGKSDFDQVNTMSILQTVQLVIWSNKDCNNTWMKTLLLPIDGTQVCALQDGKDTCTGDSGGPVAVQVDNHWVIVGITSYGNGCASPGIPGVYTRVSKFIDWIKSKIGNEFCKTS